MHLTRLVLTNFRGFASLDLALDRHLTVLVGRNGSGKSSVLDAIRTTTQMCESKPYETQTTELPSTNLHSGADQGEAGLELEHEGPRRLFMRIISRGGGWRADGYVSGLDQPIYFGMDRSGSGDPLTTGRLRDYWQAVERELVVDTIFTRFEQLLAWLREREDVENQERVRQRSFEIVDPALESTRQAIQLFLGEGYTKPRIDRGEETRLLIDKDGQPLSAASLSDGERSLIVMAGDLVRRMALAHPDATSVREAEAIVLIDEIELHLHPSWQQRIITALRETFPNAQFILTTHSPQVLAQVPAGSLRVLENFQAYSWEQPVRGRDANAILREVMGTSERPRFVLDMVAKVEEAIDQERFAEASELIDGLRELLGPDDSEVLRLGTMLHFLDVPSDTEDTSAAGHDAS